MASSYQLPRQESEEEEEDSAMAALMRSTDKEIEENCKLVRDVIKDRKKKRETIIKFEELFEKWKGGEPIEQIQAEHDERLLGYWSNLSKIQKAAKFSRVAQVVLSCPVISVSKLRETVLLSVFKFCPREKPESGNNLPLVAPVKTQ